MADKTELERLVENLGKMFPLGSLGVTGIITRQAERDRAQSQRSQARDGDSSRAETRPLPRRNPLQPTAPLPRLLPQLPQHPFIQGGPNGGWIPNPGSPFYRGGKDTPGRLVEPGGPSGYRLLSVPGGPDGRRPIRPGPGPTGGVGSNWGGR